jgi:HEAT repeat protein
MKEGHYRILRVEHGDRLMGETQESDSASRQPAGGARAAGGPVDQTSHCAALISAILSDDIGARYTAGESLRAMGREGATALVEAILEGKHDAADHVQLIDVLEDFGKLAVSPMMTAIRRLSRLSCAEDVHLLELFAGALVRVEGRKGAAQLIEQVKLLDAAAANQQKKKFAELCLAAEQRLHILLAEEGVREGLDDLLARLGEGKSRVPEDLIIALGNIGNKRALVPLLRLYNVENPVSDRGARLVKFGFKKIAQREKVTRDDAVFGTLADDEKITLDRLFPRSRTQADNNAQPRSPNGNGKTSA